METCLENELTFKYFNYIRGDFSYFCNEAWLDDKLYVLYIQVDTPIVITSERKNVT